MTLDQLLNLTPQQVDQRFGETCAGCGRPLGHPDDMIRNPNHPSSSAVTHIKSVPSGDDPAEIRKDKKPQL